MLSQLFGILYDTPSFKVLGIYLSTIMVLTVIISYALMTESLYFDFYGSQLSYERIVELIAQQERWQWVTYVALPFFFLVQLFSISCVIIGGLVMAGEKSDFNVVFKSVIVAEFFLLIPLLMKFVWFGFAYREYSLTDLQFFSPLSLASFFDLSRQPAWIVPALQSVNAFLFGYVLLLAYSLAKLFSRPFKRMLTVVAVSYGSVWVILQVFIIFLLINFG